MFGYGHQISAKSNGHQIPAKSNGHQISAKSSGLNSNQLEWSKFQLSQVGLNSTRSSQPIDPESLVSLTTHLHDLEIAGQEVDALLPISSKLKFFTWGIAIEVSFDA
ncbi:unnamed protein product [Prunus armeniaca]